MRKCVSLCGLGVVSLFALGTGAANGQAVTDFTFEQWIVKNSPVLPSEPAVAVSVVGCANDAECDEVNDVCSACGPPLVESVGSRYLAITPQPAISPTPVGFLVTSPDWPCLSKYVSGFYKCSETGGRCFTDADCSYCVGGPYDGPCLDDEDCKTCTHNHAPCQTEEDCDGNPCVQVQTCSISGETCAPHLPLDTLDISGDGLDDGFIASLVDDPADALFLTPEEWGTSLYKRCSVSFEPCTMAADCDVGRCNLTQRMCSVSEPECRNYCTISDWDCLTDTDCIAGPGDTCTVPQTCEAYETCMGRVYVTGVDILPSEKTYTTTYEVRADCGALVGPASAVMWHWADADANNVVNFADIHLGVLAFLRSFPIDIPPRTTVSVDLVGVEPCLVDQVVNFSDILQAVLAFKGSKYDPDVLAISEECDVPCP
ncbi:MAG: hypothetical protein JSU86_16515 [Phycisphaerales bacterium]|nr:MAG: hypothetical protein JSU86_16515 [Phycisphaerales bacterium]